MLRTIGSFLNLPDALILLSLSETGTVPASLLLTH